MIVSPPAIYNNALPDANPVQHGLRFGFMAHQTGASIHSTMASAASPTPWRSGVLESPSLALSTKKLRNQPDFSPSPWYWGGLIGAAIIGLSALSQPQEKSKPNKKTEKNDKPFHSPRQSDQKNNLPSKQSLPQKDRPSQSSPQTRQPSSDGLITGGTQQSGLVPEGTQTNLAESKRTPEASPSATHPSPKKPRPFQPSQQTRQPSSDGFASQTDKGSPATPDATLTDITASTGEPAMSLQNVLKNLNISLDVLRRREHRPNGAFQDVYFNCAKALDRINEYSAQKLESEHDYIQWSFPTSKKGNNIPQAAIQKTAIFAVINSPEGQKVRNLQRNIFKEHMRRHFGLEISRNEGGQPRLVPVSQPEYRAWDEFMSSANHNDLRVSRILRSCNEFGNGDLASLLYNFLKEKYEENGTVRHQTFKRWWEPAFSNSKPKLEL